MGDDQFTKRCDRKAFSLLDQEEDHETRRTIDSYDLMLAHDIFTVSINRDDIILIWVDENIDVELKNSLESIVGDVFLYSEKDDFLNKVDASSNELMVVILSGTIAEQLLPIIHDRKQIDSFYIFCIDQDRYNHLSHFYTKLSGIYTRYNELFEILKSDLQILTKQLTTFKLFDQSQKSTRNLSKESGEFLWYQFLANYLMRMTKTDESKQEMIDICRAYFKLNKSYTEQIDKFEQEYESTDAIRWYSKDGFLFRVINKAIRTEDIDCLLPLRYYIIDLRTCLKSQCDQSRDCHPEILHVYRGQKLPDEEIEKMTNSIGQLISTNGFLSTSRLPDIAKIFAENVLYEISVTTQSKNVIFADVSRYSYMPDEEEILFDLGTMFRLIDVNYNQNIQKWIIKMVTVDDGECIVDEYIEHIQEWLQEQNYSMIDYMFGYLLIIMGQYDKAVKYCENRLLSTNEKDYMELRSLYQLLADAYGQSHRTELAFKYAKLAADINDKLGMKPTVTLLALFGNIYRSKGEYELAIQYHTEAMNRKSPEDYDTAINCHINFGLVYLNQRTSIHDASSHFEHALELVEKHHSSTHMNAGRCHYNIARCYTICENYNLALEHFLKALYIEEKTEPRVCPITELTHENLAEIYLKQGDSSAATEHFLKALDINEKLLPYDKLKSTILYQQLGGCFFRMKNFQKAYAYYKKALTLCKQIFPKQNIKMARLYICIGTCCLITEDYDIMIENFKEALTVGTEYLLNVKINIKFADYANIGLACLGLKTYDLAIAYYNLALISYERSFGSVDSRETFSIHSNIGKCYKTIGNYSLANEHLKKAELIIEENDDVDMDKNEIAKFYQEMGFYQENLDCAIVYLKKSLAAYLECIPLDKYQIGFITFSIGVNFRMKSMFDVSIRYFQKAIYYLEEIIVPIEKKELLLKAYIEIAHDYIELGKDSFALQSLEYMKLLEENNFIEYHFLVGYHQHQKRKFNTALLHYNEMGESSDAQIMIARVYRQMNQYETAIKYFIKALTIEEQKISNSPSDDIYMISFLHGLIVTVLLRSNNPNRAIEYLLNALSYITQQDSHSENSSLITELQLTVEFLQCRYQLISNIGLMEETDDEQSFYGFVSFLDTLLIMENFALTTEYLKACPKTLLIEQCIGKIYFRAEKYNLAIQHTKNAVAILVSRKKDDLKLAELYNDIGWYYCSMGDFEIAMEYCMKSEQLLVGNENHLLYAYVLNSLGVIKYELGDYDQAYCYCLDSMELYATYEREEPRNYEILANIHFKIGEQTVAFYYYIESLRLMEQMIPIIHRDISRIQASISQITEIEF